MLRAIEKYLYARGWLNWLLRASLVIWVLTPVIVGFCTSIRQYDSEQARISLPFKERIQKEGELSREMQRRVERAKALGNGYTPELYFEDLKVLREATGRYPIVCLPNPTFELQECLGIRSGRFDEARFDRAREEFDKWAKPRGLSDLSGGEPINSAAFVAWLLAALAALVVFYLKWSLIAVPVYLLRMIGNGDKRVWQGAYRDRWAFAKAVLLWPYYFWSYPDWDFHKRIVAEAEVRRHGSLFRRLTKSERRQVKRLVTATDFDEARRLYRIRRAQPRFGITSALLATLILLPLVCLAQSPTAADHHGPVFSAPFAFAVSLTASDSGPPSPIMSQLALAVMPSRVDFDLPMPSPTSTVFYHPTRRIRPGPVREIFHVPLTVQTLVV